ncbi:MAG: aminotransferase class I/II-fold pyridoxal phosphate-dependent enzyme [Bryobacteraceae bacterium]
MKIPVFEMERMQSTWENVVELDMSESGVRPVTTRELMEMGLEVESFLDVPWGYSQTNGTLELRETLTAQYPGASADQIEVTNGTSEANFLIAMTLLSPGDEFAIEVPNYMQLRGLAEGLGAKVNPFRLRPERGWEPDWDEFELAVNERTRLVYLSHPHNPTGSILSPESMRRIVDRCDAMGATLIADEVYLGAEIHCERTPSFWGMGKSVIVTSGLSKAYGIPGVRIGWMAGAADLVAECWSCHDYVTIGPNKLSDRIAAFAVQPDIREKLYGRTRAILQRNLPVEREWIESFGGFLSWTEPQAGALSLVRYQGSTPSAELAERIRLRQNTMVVPGIQVGLEGYLRIWLGGREEVQREGLRRIGKEIIAMRDGQQ